jgi:tRNA A58 N-methylase Trm61
MKGELKMKLKDFVDLYLEDTPFAVTHIDDDDNFIYDTCLWWFNYRSTEEQEKLDKDFDEYIGDMYYVWNVLPGVDERLKTGYILLYVETFPRK